MRKPVDPDLRVTSANSVSDQRRRKTLLIGDATPGGSWPAAPIAPRGAMKYSADARSAAATRSAKSSVSALPSLRPNSEAKPASRLETLRRTGGLGLRPQATRYPFVLATAARLDGRRVSAKHSTMEAIALRHMQTENSKSGDPLGASGVRIRELLDFDARRRNSGSSENAATSGSPPLVRTIPVRRR